MHQSLWFSIHLQHNSNKLKAHAQSFLQQQKQLQCQITLVCRAFEPFLSQQFHAVSQVQELDTDSLA